MKHCNTCDTTKPAEAFGKRTRVKDGLQGMCKACHKAYRAENEETIAAQRKGFRQANSEALCAYQAKYRAENKEAIAETKAKYRAKNAEAIAEYRKANRDRHNAHDAAYQCGQAVPAWVDREAMVPFYTEAQRLSNETGIKHHVDHIVPRRGVDGDGVHVVSGLHTPWNLQVLTASENQSKNNTFCVESRGFK